MFKKHSKTKNNGNIERKYPLNISIDSMNMLSLVSCIYTVVFFSEVYETAEANVVESRDDNMMRILLVKSPE